MKLTKTLLLFAIISVIAISCKETKKEEVDNSAVEAVEETVEAEKTVEEAPQTNVENEVVDDMPIEEGVIVETTADTPVIYPGCEGSVEEIRACSKKEFIKFLGNNFDSNLSKDLNLEEGNHKIRAIVKINEEGKASVMRVDAPNESLENEVIRIIDKLPMMTAATKNGEPVNVSFVLPITFAVE